MVGEFYLRAHKSGPLLTVYWVLCRKVDSASAYKITKEQLQQLNSTVFQEADPEKALQLGTFVSMISSLLLRPSHGCKLSRYNLFANKDEFDHRTSFGKTTVLNVNSRGQNKSGSTNDAHLFLMNQFDPKAFNSQFWTAAQDVYLNDVMLPRQPYNCQDGPFLGQQASSLVEMAAKGMTDARTESLPGFPQARKLGPQRPVFGRIPVLPRKGDLTQHCIANSLAQSLLLPALERIGVKGPEVDNNHADNLCKLFRNQRFPELKSACVTDENVSRGSKHQQKGLSLRTVLYGARACLEPLAMIIAGEQYVKADAQGSRGWKSTHVPTYELLDREVRLLLAAAL